VKGGIHGQVCAKRDRIRVFRGCLNGRPDLLVIRGNLNRPLLTHLVQKKLSRYQGRNPCQGHENQNLDQRESFAIHRNPNDFKFKLKSFILSKTLRFAPPIKSLPFYSSFVN
jgi:hypothetical protein